MSGCRILAQGLRSCQPIEGLPAREYHGARLLVDSPQGFLSSFVCQFPLYLVPEYAVRAMPITGS